MNEEELFKIKFSEEFFRSGGDYFHVPEKKRIFLISSVRNGTDEEHEKNEKYLSQMKEKGFNVYYPKKHTFQDDPIGLTIMNTNRDAIKEAGRVDINYNPASKGSMVDIGMALYFNKQIKLVNTEIKKELPNECFVKFMTDYTKAVKKYAITKGVYAELERVKNEHAFFINHNDPHNNFNNFYNILVGMFFASEKPIFIKKNIDVPRTEGKSINNVLLELDKYYRHEN